MKKVIIYKFKGIDDLYADMKGDFYFKNQPARKVYNKGSIAVLCGRSKRGLIKLRKLAYKTFANVAEDGCPF